MHRATTRRSIQRRTLPAPDQDIVFNPPTHDRRPVAPASRKARIKLPEPTPEHEWLEQLLGEWTSESNCTVGPDGKPFRGTGREIVRSLGDLWIVAESTSDMPGGGSMSAVMTVGFDPAKGTFVGSWAGSPMTNMFVYEGRLDDQRRVLSLETTGPDFADPARTARYRDIIEIVSENERLLRSEHHTGGQWQEMMRATYRRV